MSDALSPDAAAEANREIREKLTELGVSDALVDKAEGISLWLQTHQPKLESAYSHCPCYRIDVANSLLCVGDVLLDEWQAEIVSALGSWSPSEARFTPAPHDPSCPPEFCAELQDKLSTDHCLQEIPEALAGEITDISEDHVWLLTGVMAMSLEVEGIHVAQTADRLVFLAIRGLRRVSAEERELNPRRAAKLILQIAAPVHELYQQLQALLNDQIPDVDKQWLESVLPQMLQDATMSLGHMVEEIKTCASHAEMADSPIASIFKDFFERYGKLFDQINEQAEAGNFEVALGALAEVSVSLDADLKAQAQILG